jgi:hypothetical protein
MPAHFILSLMRAAAVLGFMHALFFKQFTTSPQLVKKLVAKCSSARLCDQSSKGRTPLDVGSAAMKELVECCPVVN